MLFFLNNVDKLIFSFTEYTKVVVTFYLMSRNEFKPFPAKIQASNWLPLQLNQLETSIFEGKDLDSFFDLR